MAYLLRQTRQTAWTGDAEVTEDRRAAAHATFSLRDVDTDGVSMYATANDQQERLVVAAYACQKKEGPNKLDLLRLTDEEVERFGFVTREHGTMAVRSVNPLHRVLAWTPELLRQLVEDLLARGTRTKRYPIREVTNAVAELDPEDVDEGPHRDWVIKIRARAGR
jgi:hypothetical protein